MPEKPGKLRPALYGGIVMGLISGIPFVSLINCFCCAGILLGGYLSVFFYNKDLKPDILLTNKDAMQLGALAGVFGAIIGILLSLVFLLTVGNLTGSIMYDFITGVYEKFGILDQMPQEAIDEMQRSMTEAEFKPISILIAMIINPLFGLLGGLIGYSIHKPKPAMMNTPPSRPTAG